METVIGNDLLPAMKVILSVQLLKYLSFTISFNNIHEIGIVVAGASQKQIFSTAAHFFINQDKYSLNEKNRISRGDFVPAPRHQLNIKIDEKGNLKIENGFKKIFVGILIKISGLGLIRELRAVFDYSRAKIIYRRETNLVDKLAKCEPKELKLSVKAWLYFSISKLQSELSHLNTDSFKKTETNSKKVFPFNRANNDRMEESVFYSIDKTTIYNLNHFPSGYTKEVVWELENYILLNFVPQIKKITNSNVSKFFANGKSTGIGFILDTRFLVKIGDIQFNYIADMRFEVDLEPNSDTNIIRKILDEYSSRVKDNKSKEYEISTEYKMKMTYYQQAIDELSIATDLNSIYQSEVATFRNEQNKHQFGSGANWLIQNKISDILKRDPNENEKIYSEVLKIIISTEKTLMRKSKSSNSRNKDNYKIKVDVPNNNIQIPYNHELQRSFQVERLGEIRARTRAYNDGYQALSEYDQKVNERVYGKRHGGLDYDENSSYYAGRDAWDKDNK